jgi:hypothetical protein
VERSWYAKHNILGGRTEKSPTFPKMTVLAEILASTPQN